MVAQYTHESCIMYERLGFALLSSCTLRTAAQKDLFQLELTLSISEEKSDQYKIWGSQSGGYAQ
jgi:hypothetical protein